MRNAGMVVRWLWYYINARSTHGVHSPFIFSLIRDAIYGKDKSHVLKNIESVRKEMLKDKNTFSRTDYGAGSKKGRPGKTTWSAVIKHAATSRKEGELLFRLSRYFKVESVLELGTSAGIGTMYLAAGSPQAKVWTLEGDPVIAGRAAENFRNAGFKNISIITGPFHQTLPDLLQKIDSPDLVYMDGHHSGEATLNYFRQILPFLHNDSVIILDDIRWSDDMEKAWLQLCSEDHVTASIDLFNKGLLFFRKEQPRQRFTIRF